MKLKIIDFDHHRNGISGAPFAVVLFEDARGFTVAIILCDEGVTVDVYPLSVADEPIASTWAHYNDLPPTEGELP